MFSKYWVYLNGFKAQKCHAQLVTAGDKEFYDRLSTGRSTRLVTSTFNDQHSQRKQVKRLLDLAVM